MSAIRPEPEVLARLQNNQGSLRVRVRIPKDQQEQPVLSHLISHHGVTITIRAALLSPKAPDDGWFDLELQGASGQIRSAILELSDLGADIWPWPDVVPSL
ncbi:NIL domain-containing protein [Pseudanabaena sp. FACHB-2040]|uniref:NIL domain-containing protein n=1 Tax=Pseudanabaena sp. FACHB-2040 TaxID=2692859 RepID=UPI001689244B|nr:NIL domain-containing protein [Pseudanabaena sp. FACHB-2040]MBD0267696.1 NIL domain-containing protein [Cyanobacteria bacterium Co-bin8]MBD2260825.1 NIL domain-containing protein [Pseudanabaena sp. FACHB-2040]